MAEINANIEDVIQGLADRVGSLARENAILLAQLATAKRMLAEQEKAHESAAAAKD